MEKLDIFKFFELGLKPLTLVSQARPLINRGAIGSISDPIEVKKVFIGEIEAKTEFSLNIEAETTVFFVHLCGHVYISDHKQTIHIPSHKVVQIEGPKTLRFTHKSDRKACFLLISTEEALDIGSVSGDEYTATRSWLLNEVKSDLQGKTFFETEELLLKEVSAGVFVSKGMDISSLYFRKNPDHYNYSWHPTPRRQLVVNLTGTIALTPQDDRPEIFKPGDIFLLADLTGCHCTKLTIPGVRESLFLALA
jgi:hypothetical protein